MVGIIEVNQNPWSEGIDTGGQLVSTARMKIDHIFKLRDDVPLGVLPVIPWVPGFKNGVSVLSLLRFRVGNGGCLGLPYTRDAVSKMKNVDGARLCSAFCAFLFLSDGTFFKRMT